MLDRYDELEYLTCIYPSTVVLSAYPPNEAVKLLRGRGRRVVQEELDQTLFFSFLKLLSQLSRTDF